MVTLENGAIVKSAHGDTFNNSVWSSLYGSKGRLETAREDADGNRYNRLYVNANVDPNEPCVTETSTYLPFEKYPDIAKTFGHGGSDYFTMYNFIEKINGNKDADVIDVYEALDMSLVGLFAYRSILNGNTPIEIPNLRIKEERDKWRNDTACTSKELAGEQLLPTRKGGTPIFSQTIYYEQKKIYEQRIQELDSYTNAVLANLKTSHNK